MKYWLLKTEPETFSWQDLERKKTEMWDGVRNYQARNNLKDMKKGDQCFIYHSGEEKAIQGIAKVAKEHYPDPTTTEQGWVCVDVSFDKPLKKKVTLAAIKADPLFSQFLLVRNPRLSVMPVSEEIWDKIMLMSK